MLIKLEVGKLYKIVNNITDGAGFTQNGIPCNIPTSSCLNIGDMVLVLKEPTETTLWTANNYEHFETTLLYKDKVVVATLFDGEFELC